MCGIAGFLDARREHSDAELEATAGRMAGTLLHRGPDSGGTWVDEKAGVALAHRRLSIIDLSPEGHQPMVSACGRYVLSYNGEIYNYKQLRAELESQRVAFRGTSDTEVLLASITNVGLLETLKRSNGMFALALWDRVRRRLCLARDRFGEKPLFYGWMGAEFIFGSELRALRAHPSFRADVDRAALSLYFRHTYVPAPKSIFTGVEKLLPGTLIEIDPHAPGQVGEATRYWSPVEVAAHGLRNRLDLSAEEATDRLEALLLECVQMRMGADVGLGAFLSGGVDSSLIVAMMQASSSGVPTKTFTIGFKEEAFDEASYAARVAQHLGTDHTELYVTGADAAEQAPKLPSIYDEPFADCSQIPTHLVAALARRDVTVSLSGDGGDEMFGGYNRHAFFAKWPQVERVPPRLRPALSRLLLRVPVRQWGRVLKWSGRLGSSQSEQAAAKAMRRITGAFGAATPEAAYRFLVAHSLPDGIVLGAAGAADGAGAGAVEGGWDMPAAEQSMLLDTMGYLPDNVLTKVDRATMAVSLESRAPFLDADLMAFAWSLPPEQRLGPGGRGRWLIRRVLYRHVPQAMIDRPKAGFGIPIGEWLNGSLREWAEDLLAPGRITREGYLSSDIVSRCWAQHRAGTHDWGTELWALLMFQAWAEHATPEHTMPAHA